MVWHHKLHRGATLGARLEADVGGIDSSIANLPQDITINGQTVSPTFRYEGKNATTGLWTATVGENLIGQGSGGLVGLDTPLLDSDDKAVNGDGTRYWEAPTKFDSGVDDLVLEAVFYFPTSPSTNESIMATRSTTNGFLVRRNANIDRLQFYINGDTTARNLYTDTIASGAWHHLLVFHDYDGSTQIYINGQASGTPVGTVTGRVGDDVGITLCQYVFGFMKVAYAAGWKQSNWFDTHLQSDLAQERFARLNGTYVPGWQAWPTQANLRNSVATLEKQSPDGGQKLFTVGARWPRLERRSDKYLRYANGFNCEGQHTNVITWSEAFDNAAWAKIRCTIDSNSGAAPNYETTMDTIVEDGTAANTHFVEQTFTQSASPYTFMAVVEAMGRSWVQLELDSATDGAASAYVELSSGFIGTESGNDKARSIYLGAGLHLVSITDTRATAETCSARVYSSDGNNGRSYNGASIDAIRVWGAQVTATPYPVSYIKTEGAAVTKLPDIILYDGLSLPAKGTLAADVLDNSAAAGAYGWVMAQRNSSNFSRLYGSNLNSVGYITESGTLQVLSQGSFARSADIWTEHSFTYDTDDAKLYKDGKLLVSDASATIPTGMDKFYVGNLVSINQADALVRARLYSKPTTNFVTDFGDIMSKASAYISTPAGVSTTTSYVNVGGTWTEVYASDFTVSSAGVFTYTGANTKRFSVAGAVSGAKSGGGTVSVITCIEKNGTPVTASESARDVTGTAIGAWAVIADVELATNDTVNFAQRIASGTETLTIDKLSCVIIEGA